MGLSICWDREAPCAGVQLLGCTIQLLGMDPGCSDRAQVPTGTTLPHSFRHSIGFPQHTESEEPFPPPQPPDALPCSQVTLGYRHCQRDLPADGSSHRCISFCSLRVSPPAPSCFAWAVNGQQRFFSFPQESWDSRRPAMPITAHLDTL